MDLLGSWLDSAKQLAHNAIKDKLDSGTLASGQILLGMLHDAFAEMPEQRRQELLKVLEQVFTQYKSQDVFDFDVVYFFNVVVNNDSVCNNV